MKAVVIGANGYLGSHVADYLLESGAEVFAYGNKPFPWRAFSNYALLDITKRNEFEIVPEDAELIFFMSGKTGTTNAYDEYQPYFNVNELGLLHLLDLLRKRSSKARLVFPSTRLVYKGVKSTPLGEDAEKECKTIYAVNKWSGEQLIHQYANYFGIQFSVFRIGVPYGNRFNASYSYGTVGFFLNRARAGDSITLYGDGSQQRTFSHIDDIVDQVVTASLNKRTCNEVFNIAGETYSLLQVARLIADKHNVSVKTEPWPEFDLKLESGDTIFDSNKIELLLGYRIKKDFSEWIKNL